MLPHDLIVPTPTPPRTLRPSAGFLHKPLIQYEHGAVPVTVQRTWQPMTEGERVSRNRSPWYSLGYLLAVAVIVVVIVLLIMWVA